MSDKPTGLLQEQGDASHLTTRLPSLHSILAFEASARLGSFDRASVELSLSASAVGKRVSTLEQQLGTQLFDRSRMGLSLTVAGIEYMEQVGAALHLLSAAPLHRHRTQERLLLKVCAPPTLGREMLAPNLGDFAMREERTDVEIFLSVPYVGLRPPGAHIEILAQHDAPNEGVQLLGAEEVMPTCTPEYAERLGLRTPHDLTRALLLRSPIEPWQPWFRRAQLPWSEPGAGPRLVDTGMLLSAAAAGMGVALVRPSLARRWSTPRQLCFPFALGSVPSTSYWLRVNRAAPGYAAVARSACAFTRWIVETCLREESRRH